jgi:hypothetical protein
VDVVQQGVAGVVAGGIVLVGLVELVVHPREGPALPGVVSGRSAR